MPLSVPDDSVPACDLLCSEDAGILAEDWAGYPLVVEFPEDSDESIAGFVEGESDYSPGSDYPARFRSRSLDPSAREESVSWILEVHAYYHFRPLTAYLSVNYMDRFLSSHRLPQASGWPLQLLAVACLSLAAKMEETLAPPLLDLQLGGARYIFEPRTICKMEIMVLAALNWRLRSVTPFTFIDFFVSKADPSGTYTRFLVSRANESVLETLRGIEFLDHCPSSMAAAAIICAANEIPDLASIEPWIAEKWCIGLTKESITDCYRLMQRVIIDGTGRKPPKIIPQVRVTINTVSDASSSYSSPPNKKRKLSSKCLWVDVDKDKEKP